MQHIETPHTAVIHMLRALNCCEGQTQTVNNNLQSLIETKLFIARTNNLPCLVTIDTEIYQLKTIVAGLKNQYEIRINEAELQMQRVSNVINGQTFRSQRPEYESEYQKQIEQNKRLQHQYHSLLSKVKVIHDQNQTIIDNYGKRNTKRYA